MKKEIEKIYKKLDNIEGTLWKMKDEVEGDDRLEIIRIYNLIFKTRMKIYKIYKEVK